VSSLFFDTSAIVPLLLKEPSSPLALQAWEQAEQRYAWRWLRVEAEAALHRRQAPPEAWRNWDRIVDALYWLELPDSLVEDCCRFNRIAGLRAADAGHLFVMDRLTRVMDDLRLVTFDHEMQVAATSLGLEQLS